jgi:hypothetical protein
MVKLIADLNKWTVVACISQKVIFKRGGNSGDGGGEN